MIHARRRNLFKVVAFDLDGTLADTADLSMSRRSPATVLEHCRADQQATHLEFSRRVSRLPSRVMARGAIVAIVTRSPPAYATTLCYLLGLDYNVLLTSRDASTVAGRLNRLIEGAGIDPSELLYIGDRDADEDAADAVGAEYLFPPWLNGDLNDTGGVESLVTPVSLLYEVDCPTAAPGTLLRALQQAAATETSLSANAVDALVGADLDADFRSALAWLLLRAAPAQANRGELQQIAFEAVPHDAYDCVIPRRINYGLACVSRAVMRRAEYERGATKRDRYFTLLRHLHPPVQIHPHRMAVDHPSVPVYSFRRFHDPGGGGLLRTAKNWGGPGKGHSGPEVVLSLIELPTVVLAAQLAAGVRPVPVVPIPSSPWSRSQPGQVSARIAIDAAILSGRDFLDVLTKGDNGITCNAAGNGRSVTIIDDQLTSGTTASASLVALAGAGFTVRAALTWSASNRHFAGTPRVTTKCWFADARSLLGRSGACGPTHRQTPTDNIQDVADYLNSISP